MNSERWQRVEELYHAALERPDGQRASFLAAACDGDEDLRREVESLLAENSTVASSLLDRPAWDGDETFDATTVQLLAGKELGPYRIQRLLGSGGMGAVYQAVDSRLGRLVAIKICTGPFSLLFEREARVIAAINHPLICTLYDVGPNYLVMELLEGETLASRLKRGKLSLQDTFRYGVQLADALAAAHSKGITHRDLKPANVMLTKTGIKVLDFGVARFTQNAEVPSLHNIVMGTPAYMAPEQLQGGACDARTDIYAMGLLLCEMSSGKRGHDRQLEQPALDRIAKTCLAFDPDERWQSARDVKLALELAAHSTGRDQAQPLPRAGRGMWLTWAVIGLVLLVSGVAAWESRSLGFQNPLLGARFTRLTDFPGFEEDAAVSPDGKFVVFESDREGSYDIWVCQLATGQFFNVTKGRRSEPGILVRRIGFSGDGSQIWFAGGDEKLLMMPFMGGAIRPRFGDAIVNLDWSADGSRIVYHTSAPGDPVFSADPTGADRRPILVAEPGKHQHYPAWSTDGKWIYLVRGDFNQNDLWRISATGGAPERLTRMNTDVRYVVPFSERTVLFIATDKDGSGPWLWAFDTVQKSSHRISFGLERYTSLSASSDRRRLVATVSNPSAGLWSLPILDHIAEERDAQPYQMPTVRALAPRFGPSSLFYLSSRGTGDGLWRIRGSEAVEVWNGAEGPLVDAPAPLT